MDQTSTAQDVLRCDLCENNVAEMYCTLCPLNLCKSCVGEHISEDSKNHNVIKIERRRTTIRYPKCGFHETERCELHCQDCDIHVCSKCIVSDAHERHKFVKAEEIYDIKEEVIKRDTEELQEIIYPSYEGIAADLEMQILDLDEYYDGLTRAANKQGMDLHRVVDYCTTRHKEEIEVMKRKHLDVLKKNLERIKQKIFNIQEKVTQNNETLDSKDFSKLFSYKSKNKEYKTLPPKIISTRPVFLPQKIDERRFYAKFGSLSPFVVSNDERGYVLTTKEVLVSPPLPQLLDEPIIVKVLKTDFEPLENIVCLKGEEIWVSGRSRVIKCLNMQGKILQSCTIMSRKWPNDIALMRSGNLAYIDGSLDAVFIFQNGRSGEIIRLPSWALLSICFTFSDDLIVTMCNNSIKAAKVVRFSKFKEVQTIQFDEKGKALYSGDSDSSKYICENKNHDICVADYEGEAVVVVSQSGKFRFRYTNQDSSNRAPYRPIGIATDSQGQILTTDFCNYCIHIIDQNGHFLRYIANCDLLSPYCVCVDKNDNVLVTDFIRGTVKQIKYLERTNEV